MSNATVELPAIADIADAPIRPNNHAVAALDQAYKDVRASFASNFLHPSQVDPYLLSDQIDTIIDNLRGALNQEELKHTTTYAEYLRELIMDESLKSVIAHFMAEWKENIQSLFLSRDIHRYSVEPRFSDRGNVQHRFGLRFIITLLKTSMELNRIQEPKGDDDSHWQDQVE